MTLLQYVILQHTARIDRNELHIDIVQQSSRVYIFVRNTLGLNSIIIVITIQKGRLIPFCTIKTRVNDFGTNMINIPIILNKFREHNGNILTATTETKSKFGAFTTGATGSLTIKLKYRS